MTKVGGEEKKLLCNGENEDIVIIGSTMNDDWFSALTILASERDITDSLPTNQIIDTFAICSTKLQNILGVHADCKKT
jgi:hypothetical protein